MTSFTEFVAVMVIQSSAAAYSHFGVTLEPVQLERPAAVERAVLRAAPRPLERTTDCAAPRLPALKT